MSENIAITTKMAIWGVSIPTVGLNEFELNYLRKASKLSLPTIEWLWQEMDRVWDELNLDNKINLLEQEIGSFYTHPVWALNGVFSAVDTISDKHRTSIAESVSNLSVNRVADYGGGFGELALKLRDAIQNIQIDIVEPYPSKLGMLRMEPTQGIQFVNKFNGQYDCVIAQDVLEHVEDPLKLARDMVEATKLGGYVIFANCFYPVIKCHLPSTFYLRHTFNIVMKTMGLRHIGNIEGAEHAQVFKKVGELNFNTIYCAEKISKILGPIINYIHPKLSGFKSKFVKK